VSDAEAERQRGDLLRAVRYVVGFRRQIRVVDGGSVLATVAETSGDTDRSEYDRLFTDWRAMGREVVDQMSDREYQRRETVPFYVTVGHVRDTT